MLLTAEMLAASPFGDWLYATTAARSPGAAIPGLEFAPVDTPLHTARPGATLAG